MPTCRPAYMLDLREKKNPMPLMQTLYQRCDRDVFKAHSSSWVQDIMLVSIHWPSYMGHKRSDISFKIYLKMVMSSACGSSQFIGSELPVQKERNRNASDCTCSGEEEENKWWGGGRQWNKYMGRWFYWPDFSDSDIVQVVTTGPLAVSVCRLSNQTSRENAF